MMKLKIILEPSADGGYSVTVPSLPGCISEGDTRQKALQIIILNGNTSSLPSFSRASGLPIPLQGSLWISFIISACSILIK